MTITTPEYIRECVEQNKPVTEQEVFEAVALHLSRQKVQCMKLLGEPSEDNKPQCVYRGENGLSCAIGGIIPDSKYDPDMETKTVGLLLDNGSKFGNALSVLVPHHYLLDKLQDVHDTDMDPFYRGRSRKNTIVRNSLKKIAGDHKLDSKFLKGLDFGKWE